MSTRTITQQHGFSASIRAGAFGVIWLLAAACTVTPTRSPISPSSIPPLGPTQAISELDVLQYNIQFATPWNPGASFGPAKLPDTLDPQYWPNTTARAAAIGETIACYDIISLNETNNEDRVDEILQAMEQGAPACPDKPDRTPGPGYFEVIHGPHLGRNLGDILAGRQKGLVPNLIYLVGHLRDVRNVFARNVDNTTARQPVSDDTIALVTRLPIIETHEMIYENRFGSDSYGAKGVLHARLSLDGEALDVFVTHLQASGSQDIRAAQIKELASFIEQHSSPSVPSLLLGDLNVPGPYTRTVLSGDVPLPVPMAPHANYQDIRDILIQNLGFQDLGLDLPTGTNIVRGELDSILDDASAKTCKDDATTQETDESRASLCQRIDYIFVAARGAKVSVKDVTVQKFDDQGWHDLPTLSDHASVAARLDWAGTTPE